MLLFCGFWGRGEYGLALSLTFIKKESGTHKVPLSDWSGSQI
jgi:hypothetical protein